MTAARRLAACVAMLLGSAAFAGAEPNVQVRLALGGNTRQGSWVTVRIEVENPDAEMKLLARVEGDGADSTRELVCPAGSRKAWWIPVRASGRISVFVMAGSKEIYAAKERRNPADPGPRPFVPTFVAPRQRLILVVNESPERAINESPCKLNPANTYRLVFTAERRFLTPEVKFNSAAMRP